MSRDSRMAAYSVVRAVGKGSYGEVFLVTHCKEKKQYVMKNMKLTAASVKERSAAEQEAALLSKLRHPNIVAYKESFQDEHGILHIVMSYCEGGDLCTRLKANKGRLLPEAQVVEWFVQITLALQYLHNHKILHRDLKTQNIFLSKNNIVKVGDLGIARVLDGSCDLASTVIGTPYYMSPELFANKPYDYKSDIWALGCCVYEIASLRHAFTATNINALMCRILQGKVPPLPACFSEELGRLVQTMLALNAKDRPSVNEILRTELIRKHIRTFLEGVAQKKKAESDLKKGREGVRRSSGDPPSGLPRPNGDPPSGLPRPSGDPPSGLSRPSGDPPSVPRRPSGDPPVGPRRPSGHQPPGLPRPGLSVQEGSRLSEAKRSSSDCSINSSRSSPSFSPNGKGHRHSSVGEASEGAKDASEGPKDVSRHKPSLPHPPDPVVMVTPQSEISSARQRRRISKQGAVGGGGARARIVLRPRGGVAGGGSGQQSSEVSASDGTDGPEVEQPSRVQPDADSCGPDHVVPSDQQVERVPLVPSSATPPTPLARDDEATPTTPSAPDDGNEVDEFFTLLDTTLHLPEAQAEPAMDAPPPKVAFANGVGGGVGRTTGRLGDRVVALRQECLHGLGSDLMARAYGLLDSVDPEEAEGAMKELLGKDLFECFAAKLQELKLCEDSLHDL